MKRPFRMNLELFRSAVRPIVTYALIVAFIAAVFVRLVPGEALRDLAIAVASFWFGQRSSDRRSTDPS